MATLVNARFMGDMVAALAEIGVSVDGPQKELVISSSLTGGANTSSKHDVNCPTHTGQSLSYFCVTCSTALCSDCAMFDASHRGHEFAKLDTVYSDHVSLVRVELDALKARLAQLDTFLVRTTGQIDTLQTNKMNHMHALREQVLQIHKNVEAEAEAKMKGWIEKKQEVMKGHTHDEGQTHDDTSFFD